MEISEKITCVINFPTFFYWSLVRVTLAQIIHKVVWGNQTQASSEHYIQSSNDDNSNVFDAATIDAHPFIPMTCTLKHMNHCIAACLLDSVLQWLHYQACGKHFCMLTCVPLELCPQLLLLLFKSWCLYFLVTNYNCLKLSSN